MVDIGIPTAEGRLVEAEDVIDVAAEFRNRCVIKVDGLARGKGSYICRTKAEVLQALRSIRGDSELSQQRLLVEEWLDGEELSVFSVSDGSTTYPFGAAQDHKRAFEGDEGPIPAGWGHTARFHSWPN